MGILPGQQPDHWTVTPMLSHSCWDSLNTLWLLLSSPPLWWGLCRGICLVVSQLLDLQPKWQLKPPGIVMLSLRPQETGPFPQCIAWKFLSENLWSVASWESDQGIEMVPFVDKINAIYLVLWVSILFSGILHRNLRQCVSEAEKCSTWWKPGVSQHMEIEGASTFPWEQWNLCDLFQYLLFIVLGVDLLTWSFPRWKLLDRKNLSMS